MGQEPFGTARAANTGIMANIPSPDARQWIAIGQQCVNPAHCAGTATNPYLWSGAGRSGPGGASGRSFLGVAEIYGSNGQFKVTKTAFSVDFTEFYLRKPNENLFATVRIMH